jgi:hypothetical protein
MVTEEETSQFYYKCCVNCGDRFPIRVLNQFIGDPDGETGGVMEEKWGADIQGKKYSRCEACS